MNHFLALKKYSVMLPLFAFLCIFLPSGKMQAESFDTKGKNFHFTFIPNFHSPSTEDVDSVYVYITAEEPTNVTVKFTNANNQVETKTLAITDVSRAYSLAYYHYRHELVGEYNSEMFMWDPAPPSNEEAPSKIGVEIIADHEINVYGLSTSTKSSDAFLVYPDDVLGTEYYVMAYYSDNISSYTPSEFAIVAIEDGTTVEITPATTTANGRTTRFSQNLNAGEAYLVQSRESINSKDLTGTFISSNKKIAVFGGQQRATVPSNKRIYYSSRDMLSAQVPPLHTWGKDAIVIPFPQPSNIAKDYNDVYRILSAADGNIVDIDGEKVTINAGKFIERDILDKPIVISAEEQILVAQYKRSSETRASTQTIYKSDPLFLILPPKEQFIRESLLMNMQKYESSESVFTDQYIIIVAPNENIASCRIDNSALGTSNFTPIANTDYSYYVRTSSDGVHRFTSDGKCGLYVVGYGDANSYGYVGGMEMNDIKDTIPPSITFEQECFRHTCTISDELGDSEGLSEIRVIQEQLQNVKVTLPTDYYGQRSATISAELIDPTQDGIYAIRIIDIQNNETTIADTIQGRTLHVEYVQGVDNVIDSVTVGTQICRQITLSNTGFLPYELSNQNIRLLVGERFSIPQSQLPMTIYPNESRDLIVCTNPISAEEILFDTLNISPNCYTLGVPLKTTAVKVEGESTTKCGLPITLTLSEVVDEMIFDNIIIDEANESGKIIFGLPKPNATKIVLYDVSGNMLAELFAGEMSSGLFEFNFGYSDYPSGTYFVKLGSGDKSLTRKFIINR